MLSKEAWYTLVIGLVLGGILSIPLQLFTGLLFPGVQRWFDARMRARAFAKSKRMQKQYEEAHYFVTYPDKMTHYFLNRAVELLRWIVFVGLGLAGLMLLKPGPVAGWALHSQWLAALGFLFSIVFFSQSVNELHAIYYRVEFWNEYRQKVLSEFPDLEKAR